MTRTPVWLLPNLQDSYYRHLQSSSIKPGTISNYEVMFNHFTTWLSNTSKSIEIAKITTDDMREYIISMQEKLKPSTISVRYVLLKAFFAWCVEEEILDRSPMAKMKQPRAPKNEKYILSNEELKILFAICNDRHDYYDVRDLAIMRFLLDSGIRAAECCALTMTDVHMDKTTYAATIRHGKGDKYRVVTFGAKTATHIDRYLRFRAQHKKAELPLFWLGQQGAFTMVGLGAMVEKRAMQAGLWTNEHHITPHTFRHTFIDRMKRSGMLEENIMQLTGHSSTEVFRDYAARLRRERALDAYNGHAPGDQL
jgi:integrase/recombinase XerC